MTGIRTFGGGKPSLVEIGIDCYRTTRYAMRLPISPENLIQQLQFTGITTSVLKSKFYKACYSF